MPCNLFLHSIVFVDHKKIRLYTFEIAERWIGGCSDEKDCNCDVSHFECRHRRLHFSKHNAGFVLKSGSYAVYQAKGTDIQKLRQNMEQERTILQNRLAAKQIDAFKLVSIGNDCIRVEIPNTQPPAGLFELIGKTAKLEFTDHNGTVLLTGKHIIKASSAEMMGNYGVSIKFDSEGTKQFDDVTCKMVGQTLTIVVDGVAISSPSVNTPITGGEAFIEGCFSKQQADDLASLLQSGALPLDLHIIQTGNINSQN
jgi:preprotein translocase subunit SecD